MAVTDTPAALSGPAQYAVIGAAGALILCAGLVILWSRSRLEGSSKTRAANAADGGASTGTGDASSDRSVVRSWLAISLVGALVLLCAASFGLPDTTLRSSLIGGLVASAGAAVAFYFASKASDQARQDILAAATHGVQVPKLTGKTRTDVNAMIASLPLTVVASPQDADAASIAQAQDPAANTIIRAGSSVTVTFSKGTADLKGAPAPAPDATGAAAGAPITKTS